MIDYINSLKSISPGLVETEFMSRTFDEKKASTIYSSVDVLQAQDIADIILFILSGPPNVQVTLQKKLIN